MIKQIEDLTLIKSLGSGDFGEVFLSTKKGRNKYFAAKKIDRITADQTEIIKYLKTELSILKKLNHPNIVKLEEVKATKDNYYIVMEYINGGGIVKCLEKYMNKYGKPFSEEIVQYLMRQIVDAIKYIHSLNIIHRVIKSKNIMIKFENEIDKLNLNMMRAKVKIIDFDFSCYTKNGLAYTIVGSPMYMDPLILNALYDNKPTQGYDEKIDIWSLGVLCYELFVGHSVFNAESLDELVKMVENGAYNIPINLSKEVVSFLNGMLQYEAKNRYSAEELANHPFLKKRVQDFQRFDLRKDQKII